MGIRGIPRIVAAAIGAAALLLTSGCTLVAGASAEAEAAERGEERVATTVYRLGLDQPDIGAVARDLMNASEMLAGTIELIGVEEGSAEFDGDDLGAVRLRVLFSEAQDSPHLFQDQEQLPAVCFRVTWNRYHDTGTDRIDCPPDAERIEPPVDTSTVFVIPADAGEVTQAVLRELPATPPPAEEIAAMIDARVTAPTGELEQAYPADVALDGDDVGVAFGLHTDCQMVLRIDGEVGLSHVRWTSLQEGEGGCHAETALHPPL